MACRTFLFNRQMKKCVVRMFSTSQISTQMVDEKYVSLKQAEGVRTITLNHPASHNSLSLHMLKAILTAIKKNENDETLRSIVINSASGKVFSAGHNLKELTAGNESLHSGIFDTCSELMEAIRQSPVPIIAAVDGLAAAAGCQLVAACDIAVCTERSTFSTPGANVGVFCSTPAIPLVRNIPQKAAMYMLFTGLPITAKEALDVGLVSKVASNNALAEEVAHITSCIAKKSRSVIHVGKKFLYEQMNCDIETAYKMGSAQMVENLKMDDAQEGIRGFIEKRTPKWNHKY